MGWKQSGSTNALSAGASSSRPSYSTRLSVAEWEVWQQLSVYAAWTQRSTQSYAVAIRMKQLCPNSLPTVFAVLCQNHSPVPNWPMPFKERSNWLTATEAVESYWLRVEIQSPSPQRHLNLSRP